MTKNKLAMACVDGIARDLNCSPQDVMNAFLMKRMGKPLFKGICPKKAGVRRKVSRVE